MKTHLLDIPASNNPMHADHLGKTWCGRTLTGRSMVGAFSDKPGEEPTCLTCKHILSRANQK